jgi:hypothetical protein
VETTDTIYEAWLRNAISDIAEQISRFPNAPLYALIDGAQIDNIEVKISKFRAPFAKPLFDNTTEAALKEVSPWLVLADKNATQSKFIRRCLELQGASHSITWIISPLDSDALFQSLTQRTSATLSGNLDMMLRYFDTYRLPDLHSVLEEDQKNIFFGCANAWIYIDRQGEVAVIESSYAPQDAFTALVFTESQEQRILDASFPDELLRILQQDQAELVEEMPPQERYDQVKALVESAKNYKIENTKDLLYFCIVALSEGDDFNEQPKWAEILDKVKTGSASFAEAAVA